MNEGEKSDYDEEEKDYNYAVVPPNGGWGWMVVACAFYCSVVVDGIQLTFGVFLKEISKSFNTDLSRVALAGSLMFGVHLIVGKLKSTKVPSGTSGVRILGSAPYVFFFAWPVYPPVRKGSFNKREHCF